MLIFGDEGLHDTDGAQFSRRRLDLPVGQRTHSYVYLIYGIVYTEWGTFISLARPLT